MTEESTKKQLDELKGLRSNARGCITRIKTYIYSKADTLSSTELDCRLGILESYWKLLLSHQSSIEKLVPDDPQNIITRGELEDLYCDVKSKILTLLPAKGRSSMDGNTTVLPPSNSNKPKLPPIQLPQFSGRYSDYPKFIATFNKLVHDDQDKSITEKYTHLINCLSGSALRAVESLGTSAITYTQALQILKDRFDNKCLIFQEHVSDLFDLPKVNKGSAVQLRSLVDNISAHLSALRALGNDTDILNSIIIHMASSRLDTESQARWDEAIDYAKFPTWEDCDKILSRRCQFLEARESKSGTAETHSASSKYRNVKADKRRSATSLEVIHPGCNYCSENTHIITDCKSFSQLSALQRFEKAKNLALCINCLRKGHSIKSCRSSSRCRVCNKLHHTMLHRFSDSRKQSSDDQHTSLVAGYSNSIEVVSTQPDVTTPSVLCSAVEDNGDQRSKDHVFLATAIVKIKDQSNYYHLARALLDSASQLNFITGNLAHKLKLKRHYISTDINGIGELSSKVRYQTNAKIKSRVNDYEMDVDMWILPSITSLQPDTTFNVQDWNIPNNIVLADPEFYKAQKIDILIGAEWFFQLLSVGQIKLNKNLPSLQKTLLGWIVGGKYSVSSAIKHICVASSSEHQQADDNLTLLVERFWEIEGIASRPAKLSSEHQMCEDIFASTTSQQDDGRFVVKLPLKAPESSLGNSYDIAKHRLLSLEKRLRKNPEIKEQYANFIKEYTELGHMKMISHRDLPRHHYYMPHSYVLRPQSSSTKLRVVFDASCKTSSQISLNDILIVGPTVQQDLFSILLRFRCWKFALTADVSKMYRQILVRPEDRHLQCIAWRDQVTNEIQTYQLNTVTYGTASAPYLATRCLIRIADNHASSLPSISRIIKEDFYVDDVLTGADTEEEVILIKEQLQKALSSAKFDLRKWYSNVNSLLNEIPETDKEKPLKMHNLEIIKTLGMSWDATNDNFLFTFTVSEDTNSRVTKRTILSRMSRLFDPLGLINPIIVRAKIFMQEVWLLKLHWDESLPQEFITRWENYLNDMKDIHTLKIPRFILSYFTIQRLEIHGFSDASNRAYGCNIYARCVDINGKISVHLLAAKSKVAPTKTVKTLPCLELCGAELLSQLLVRITQHFTKQINATYLWTDSQIVLGWLSSHPSNWKTFVANRVSLIQERTQNAEWRYVPTKSNPADIVSRGSTVKELQSSIWFRGPEFLLQSMNNWPERKIKMTSLPEQKKLQTILTCASAINNLDIISNCSNYAKLRRIFAYVLRFVSKSRLKGNPAERSGILTATELQAAELKLVWIVQQTAFANEIKTLKGGATLPSGHSLQSLNPFLDKDDLLRVGGRLLNANLPYETKHPLLLPKCHQFVKHYIIYVHRKNFHAGPQALVATIRQKFWIMNARNYARQVVRECIHCFRYRPKLMQQIMGNLPAHRLIGTSAFENVGVDFCGPISTTMKIRGKRPYKSYIAVFVCFLSRGVHMEVVSDLSSEAFLAALKRFVSRRRLCKHLHCDNATNFVGARRQLMELKKAFWNQQTQKNIAEWCAEESIEMHHIPPRAPHFGGIWEAAVRSAKSHLLRTLQNALLTFEELSTVCCQIEAILNSRPLCQLSSNPNDEEALTPAHFWSQAPLNSILEPILEANVSLTNRWRRITALQQHFWKRWSAEYILSLNSRYKWKVPSPNITLGSLVLIHDDNLPPQKWLLGRITKIIPGPDAKIRVVDVQTKGGELRRPIHKLAPLPTTEEA